VASTEFTKPEAWNAEIFIPLLNFDNRLLKIQEWFKSSVSIILSPRSLRTPRFKHYLVAAMLLQELYGEKFLILNSLEDSSVIANFSKYM